MGDRSPHAPTDPLSNTTGVTPLFSIWTSVSTMSRRGPEWPWARTLMREHIAARTTSTGSGAPQPAAWL